MKKKLLKLFSILTFLLILSNVKITTSHATETTTPNSEKLLGPNDVFDASKYPAISLDYRETSSNPITKKPAKKLTQSTINALVVLIDFPVSETSSNSDTINSNSVYSDTNISQIESAFNDSTYSLKNYISTISRNQCKVEPYLAFKKNTTNLVYIAKHPVEYYRPYKEILNPTGYKNYFEKKSRETDLINSCFISIKSYIPSTLDLDVDDDSYIDAIDFFVPYQDNWGDLLWPHKTSFSKNNNTKVNDAYLNNINLITMPYFNSYKYKVVSHEFLHILKFPDMYVYDDSSTTLSNPNLWTMMSINRGFPTVRELIRYGGWISDDDIPIINETKSYTLYDLSHDSTHYNVAYKITIPNSDEFFMVEYRNASANIYEAELYAHGIIVYRVDPNKCGNEYGAPEIYVLRNTNSFYGNLDGTVTNSTNNDYIKLTLSSGTDTGYIIDYGYKSSTSSVSFNLIKNNELNIPTITSSLGDSFYNLHKTKLSINNASSKNTGDLKYSLSVNGNFLFSNSSSPSTYWTPDKPGTYNIVGYVTDSKNITVSTSKTLNIKSYNYAISSITSSLGNSFKNIYTTNLSITANSQSGGLRYTLKANDTYLLNNSTSSSVSWTPVTTGTYTITASVKDAHNIVLTKTITINVKEYDFYLSSFSSSLGISFDVNELTTITANAVSDKGGLTYSFYLNDVLIKNTSSNSILWETDTIGTYSFKVIVKDAGNKSTTSYLTLYVGVEPPPLKRNPSVGIKLPDTIKPFKPIIKPILPIIIKR